MTFQPVSAEYGFGEALKAAGAKFGRLCVGIDPHAQLLEKWGLGANVDGLKRFTDACVVAFSGNVALVKPQVAFYEAFGHQGFKILEDAIDALRAAGTLVVADAKRGDIGSTMAGYATAWLEDRSPLCSDAVTVSPFLGFGSLSPAFEVSQSTGRGVFVLAATSNPEARQLQDQANADGVSISQQMVDAAAALNAAAGHQGQAGNIGVVIGATLAAPPRLNELNGPVLLPGVGAQGASAADVARITEGVEDLSFANISRAILSAGPSAKDLRDAALRAAAEFS
ncbi:orotidine-5'-phosphate decarboxylase [Corynebacterium felinum]|uniref:Orotidine 5'-phosphate decarboxylase n=1 Tax=Corynebacterium felinum TaxID=131318 RepID=A0ABU2BAX6_9CORY|nr:orotidine-5'-phosphate decarboxylase [Corynebacterium felinum]MDF5821952.1 orotidine-5'-phosphate decarboxylase [Corynebacterium felinum]MDR7355755.1 orotidine-5'-phosphate decarboxylase [Corynebacterium felinum]WJY95101.1 orotidine 5'-phosphate decarboxylase [Corynebacterium felinum]